MFAWLLHALAFVLVLIVPVTVRAATDAELPYAAWQGDAHAKPEAAVLERGPAPLPEPPEQARRLWEFVPDFGVALPGCRGRGADCQGVRPGLELGVSGLYRPFAFFALGVTARLDTFSVARAEGARTAQATFFGAALRLYAFESGMFDPYLELAVGGGSLETSAARSGQREGTHVALAPAARIAGGLDFALSPWLRLGPALAMSQYASGNATYCTHAGCTTRSDRQSALPRGATSFGFRLTIALGERL